MSKAVEAKTFIAVPDTICQYAVNNLPNKKNEDRILEKSEGIPGVCDGVIGVCDGHNGHFAADYVSQNLVDQIAKEMGSDLDVVEGNAWPKHMNDCIKAVFASQDAEVKKQHQGGTTCTVCFVKRGVDDKVHIKVAWVGDSRAMLVVPGERELKAITKDHRVENKAEAARIQRFYSSLTHEAHRASVAGSMVPIDPRKELYARPVLESTAHFESGSSPDVGRSLQPTILDPAHRMQSFAGVFVNKSGAQLSQQPRLFSSAGSSSGVTRSIGDIAGARGLICEPEIRDLDITSFTRIIIGSDGVWDVLPEKQAYDPIAKPATVDQCATRVVQAVKRTCENCAIRQDDTTVVALDIFPLPVDPNSQQSCACIIA